MKNICNSMASLLFSGLRHITDIIVMFLTAILLIPTLFLLIWKWIVSFFAKHFKDGLIPLTPIDLLNVATFDKDLYHESKNLNMNLGIACILSGIVNGEELFQRCVDQVIKVKPPYKNADPHIRFHQCITMYGGYWFFKTFRNKLRYEDHATVMTLPSDSSFEEELAKWLKIRYDGSCPLWGFLLIHRPSTEETFAALKMHHVLADGYSMLHIVDLLTDTKFTYQVRSFNYNCFEKLYMLKRGLPCVYLSLLKHLLLPRSLFCQREDEDIFITQTVFPVSTIKEIRRKALVHFATVMFSLVRSFILELMHEVCTPESEFPGKIAIATSLPWPNHPLETLCNDRTAATFHFKTNKQPGPMESLADMERRFAKYFLNFTDKALHAVSGPISTIPHSLLTSMSDEKEMDRMSAVYVHMVGSEKYEKVLQYPCKDLQAFVMHPRQKGVNVVCVTTGGEIRVNIVGPKYMFPTQERAKEFTRESFQRNINHLLATEGSCVVVK